VFLVLLFFFVVFPPIIYRYPPCVTTLYPPPSVPASNLYRPFPVPPFPGNCKCIAVASSHVRSLYSYITKLLLLSSHVLDFPPTPVGPPPLYRVTDTYPPRFPLARSKFVVPQLSCRSTCSLLFFFAYHLQLIP